LTFQFTKFDFILIYQFPALSTEIPNTKAYIRNPSGKLKKSIFCWNEAKIKVWKTQRN